MKEIQTKREQEKRMVSEMIALYCQKKHGTPKGRLCPECTELTEYARQRSDRCPFMETKTFCSNFKVHCYSPDMREKIRTVMRYSGPRMIFHHPAAAIRHVISTMAEKRRIKKSWASRESFSYYLAASACVWARWVCSCQSCLQRHSIFWPSSSSPTAPKSCTTGFWEPSSIKSIWNPS